MAILNNCTLFHIRCTPDKPNAMYNKQNPTWEVQIRTTEPAQKEEWLAANLRPKLMVYKEGHEREGEPILTEDGKRQWKVTLKKKSIDKKGNPAKPVTVAAGDLSPLDPSTIGNGSKANVRVFQYEYKNDTKEGIASILMAIQVTKLKRYVPKLGEEFQMMEMAVEEPDDDDDGGEPAMVPAKPVTSLDGTPPPVKGGVTERSATDF